MRSPGSWGAQTKPNHPCRVYFQNLYRTAFMTPTRKTNPLIELLINIVIPAVILMKFSG